MSIDPLLVELSKPGYGCRLDGVYTGALSYVDDITISCPSINWLNKMLKICDKFLLHNSIIFNSKNTVCIKCGDKIIEREKANFNVIYLEWADSVRHLGNYIDITCTDIIDCKVKILVLLDMLIS